MWRDWCPLCGARFEAETAEEISDKILAHLEPDQDGKSDCNSHFVPPAQALADSHYNARTPRIIY